MRLIDADALKERAIRVSTVKEHCYFKAVGTREIDRAPTIDAVPVVHGRWISIRENVFNLDFPVVVGWYCSECDIAGYEGHNYCPNCGAKMDKNENM